MTQTIHAAHETMWNIADSQQATGRSSFRRTPSTMYDMLVSMIASRGITCGSRTIDPAAFFRILKAALSSEEKELRVFTVWWMRKAIGWNLRRTTPLTIKAKQLMALKACGENNTSLFFKLYPRHERSKAFASEFTRIKTAVLREQAATGIQPR